MSNCIDPLNINFKPSYASPTPSPSPSPTPSPTPSPSPSPTPSPTPSPCQDFSSLIYNITYSARTTTSVTVTWKSTIPLTSRVLYGTENILCPLSYPNYGYQNSTAENTQLTTTHSVTVTGLLPSTTYYFRPVGHI